MYTEHSLKPRVKKKYSFKIYKRMCLSLQSSSSSSSVSSIEKRKCVWHHENSAKCSRILVRQIKKKEKGPIFFLVVLFRILFVSS